MEIEKTKMVVKLLIIGLGGFTGAILRYLVSSATQASSGSELFPYGTLSVNLIGCFVIGGLSFAVESWGMFTAQTRFFLLVGFLGSFTTFSTFGHETLSLIRQGHPLLAGINASVHLFLGLLCVWLGRQVAFLIWK